MPRRRSRTKNGSQVPRVGHSVQEQDQPFACFSRETRFDRVVFSGGDAGHHTVVSLLRPSDHPVELFPGSKPNRDRPVLARVSSSAALSSTLPP